MGANLLIFSLKCRKCWFFMYFHVRQYQRLLLKNIPSRISSVPSRK